eukprot:9144042-Heterocapsa_arctica.AAC.1
MALRGESEVSGSDVLAVEGVALRRGSGGHGPGSPGGGPRRPRRRPAPGPGQQPLLLFPKPQPLVRGRLGIGSE